MTRTLAAVLLALLAAQTASAQSTGEQANILGRWNFISDPTYENCSLSGEVVFTQGPSENLFQCTIIANDLCPGVWSYRAEETCVAHRDGDQLTIQSQVLQVKPDTGNYLPDDFILTIVDSARMTGRLISALVTPAEFYRGDPNIG